MGLVGLFIAIFLQILLNHKSSQEFDVVYKPNLHYKNEIDGLKA